MVRQIHVPQIDEESRLPSMKVAMYDEGEPMVPAALSIVGAARLEFLMSSTIESLTMHPAELTTEQLLRDCKEHRGRRSGPGGQHRNKVETAVILTHVPSGVRAEATERRSQHENRQVATARLRIRLALDVRSPRDQSHGPSTRWKARCRNRRIRVNRDHEDFPPLLAEALDFLAICDYDVRAVAQGLDVTPSQLVRFLKIEPRALEQVNKQRSERGQGRLR